MIRHMMSACTASDQCMISRVISAWSATWLVHDHSCDQCMFSHVNPHYQLWMGKIKQSSPLNWILLCYHRWLVTIASDKNVLSPQLDIIFCYLDFGSWYKVNVQPGTYNDYKPDIRYTKESSLDLLDAVMTV